VVEADKNVVQAASLYCQPVLCIACLYRDADQPKIIVILTVEHR